MKKLFTTSLFIFLLAQSYAQFEPLTVTYPSSVDLFDMFEASFKLPMSYTNPYDPDTILVYGVFTGPNSSSDTVHAFYYEGFSFQQHNGYELATRVPSDDGWRIRFTPTQTGAWSFKVRAFNVNGEVTASHLNVNYTFTCNSISSGEGFISKANSRYLKRDMVRKGHRIYGSFFPVGLNIAWYDNKNNNVTKPLGIYQYEDYIDSLDGNANYMRVFFGRFQHLSLYGPEYALNNGQTIVYFDSTLNQKDAAEMDHIVTYARQHGVTIMPCMFSDGSFKYSNSFDAGDSTIWANNPFNTIISSPCDFFSNEDAIRIARNLIRYIVSRWGYATNIMSWELWNEVNHVTELCNNEHIDTDVLTWHEDMAAYIKSIDPFHHCISTSLGSNGPNTYYYYDLYSGLDFVQHHCYDYIQNAESRRQLSYKHYNKSCQALNLFLSKPFFMAEFGFDQNDTLPKYKKKDPKGIDLHNFLWSSLFSTSIGPASFWWWPYVDTQGLFKHYKPVYVFCNNLPILSETFTPHITGHVNINTLEFPNNIETYYMINTTEDTIIGWSQDTAFAYQSLRWLTDNVHYEIFNNNSRLCFDKNGVFDTLGYVYTLEVSKRPQPSSNSNTIRIPITNQPVGTSYSVVWYNSETGIIYNVGIVITTSVILDNSGEKIVSFSFPSYIRNLQNHTVSNTFGDAVFMLTKRYGPDYDIKETENN